MRNLVAAALTLALLGGVATAAQADERHSGFDKARTEQRDHDKDDHRNDGRNQDRAHNRDGKNDNDKDRDWRRDDRFDNRHDHGHDYRRDDHRRDHHVRYDRDHHRYGHYVKPDGYRYRAWRHGDHLPRSYRSNRYIVNDYHVYRLRPPPRGYHWIRVDNDVILAAIATGLVAQAIYGVF